MKNETHDEILMTTLVHTHAALGVIVLNPVIKEFLQEHDPKALEQAESAYFLAHRALTY